MRKIEKSNPYVRFIFLFFTAALMRSARPLINYPFLLTIVINCQFYSPQTRSIFKVLQLFKHFEWQRNIETILKCHLIVLTSAEQIIYWNEKNGICTLIGLKSKISPQLKTLFASLLIAPFVAYLNSTLLCNCCWLNIWILQDALLHC